MKISKFFILSLLLLVNFFCVYPAFAQMDKKKEDSQEISLSLLQGISNSTIDVPSIGSKSFCETLSDRPKEECIKSNKFGLVLYDELNQAQKKMKTLPFKEFSGNLSLWASVRDKVWSKRGYGNVLLANLANQMIFWNLASKMANVEESDLANLKNALKYFRPITDDWRNVVGSVELDSQTSLNLPVNNGDDWNAQDVYAQASVSALLLENAKGQDVKSSVGKIPIKDALDAPKYAFLFSDLSFSWTSDTVLNLYFDLRNGTKNFPKSDGSLTMSEDVNKGQRLFGSAEDFFRKRVPLVVLKGSIDTDKDGLDRYEWSSFYRIFLQADKINAGGSIESLFN